MQDRSLTRPAEHHRGNSPLAAPTRQVEPLPGRSWGAAKPPGLGGDLGVKGQLEEAIFPTASLNPPLPAAPAGWVAAGALVRWRGWERGSSAHSPAGQRPGRPACFSRICQIMRVLFQRGVGWPSRLCLSFKAIRRAGALLLAQHSRRGLGSRAGVAPCDVSSLGSRCLLETRASPLRGKNSPTLFFPGICNA